MSIPLPTRAEIETAAIAYFQTAHRNPSTGIAPPLGPRTFCGQEARALANLLNEVLSAVKSVDDDAIPGTYIDAQGVTRTRNSSRALEDWAYTLGIPSSVAGRYGRRGAFPASGGAATASGTIGVIITTGAELTDLSGTVTVKVRAGITIDGVSDGITLDAVTTGEAGNLPIGTILRWSSPPPGLAATVTLTTALSGGYDIESDVHLALRIIARLQDPLRGGTLADYRWWAENSTDSNGLLIGIDRAYVYKHRNGIGTVDIIITQAGTGDGRDPGATKKTQVEEYIASVCPAGDGGFNVFRPTFISGQELTIRVRVAPQPEYEFDWDDEQGTLPLVCESGCTGTTLIVDYTTPADSAAIRAAVDAGSKPRVQIPTASSSAIPFVSEVDDYDIDTPMAGQLTLQLVIALPSSPLPIAGDNVYAAGSAVLPIAIAVTSHVDSLGPSRAGGKASRSDKWEDQVYVSRIGKIAIDTVDSDGQSVCVTSPNIGDIGGLTTESGVLIQIGAGSETAADYATSDADITVGPQFAEVAHVIVNKGGV